MKKLKMVINTEHRLGHINKELYGQFMEHAGRGVYEGLFVGEQSDIPNTNGIRDDVFEALKRIHVPVIRWPGGCFAETYHWKDGIGKKRKKMVNKWWGKKVEDNSFGTHEFLDFCERLGCEPYLVANNASSTVQEIDEWIEYITYDGDSEMANLRKKNGRDKPWRLKYFCVGNEFQTCGGDMSPEYYISEYKCRQRFCWNYQDIPLYRIVRGMHTDQFEVTDQLVNLLEREHFDAATIYLIISSGHNDTATEFDQDMYYDTLLSAYRIDKAIDRHMGIIRKKPSLDDIQLMVDEWGTWHREDPNDIPSELYRQNTMRDAIVAATVLNIFNHHCNDLELCCLCMTINTLDSIILTNGPQMVLTPTYHVFDLYQHHQDSELLDSYLETPILTLEKGAIPTLSHSVSMDKEENLILTVTNISLDEDYEIEGQILYRQITTCEGEILTAEAHEYNDFTNSNKVTPREYTGYSLYNGLLKIKVPHTSIIKLILN